jgi:MarR family transcriptional regulator, organic hydroperoxide resistance regulator
MAGHPATPPSEPEAAFIDGYLAYLLARASHLISAEFHVVVRRARLPVLQWRVLATLADGQMLSIGEVAQVVLIPQSTLTRVAERMVQAGLLVRATDANDRRFTRIRLSANGLKLAGKLVQQARAHEAAVVQALGQADAQALKRILGGLIEQHAAPAAGGAPVQPATGSTV